MGSSREHSNSDVLLRLIEKPQVFDPEKVPYEQVGSTPVDPEYFPALTFFQTVEGLVGEHYADLVLRNPLNIADPITVEAVTMWEREETQHSVGWVRFNAEVRGTAGELVPEVAKPLRPDPSQLQRFGEWFVYDALPEIGGERYWRIVRAIGFMIGEANEDLTARGYADLAARLNHPIFTAMSRAIRPDEGKHLKIYRLQRQAEMAELGQFERWLARFAFRYFYRPVGVPSRPFEEFARVAVLLDPDGNSDVGRRIDRAMMGELGQKPGDRVVDRQMARAYEVGMRLVEKAAA